MIERLYRELPHLLWHILDEVGRAGGTLPPLHPAAFTAHTHRPDELRAEAADAGLVVEDLVGVEGLLRAARPGGAAGRRPDRAGAARQPARALQRVPELLGLSPHLLVVAPVP